MKLFTVGLALLAAMLPMDTKALSNWDNVKEELVTTSLDTEYDLDSLVSIAYVESSFRTNVSNSKSSAVGLMQITKPTGKYLLSKYGHQVGLNSKSDLRDPTVSSLMGAFYLKEVKGIMEKHLGRKITKVENYLGYKFSPYRASRLLQASRSTTLLDFYPEAATHNGGVYYYEGKPRTLGQVIDLFERRLNRASKRYSGEANYLLEIVKSVRYDRVKELFSAKHYDCNSLAYKANLLKNELNKLVYNNSTLLIDRENTSGASTSSANYTLAMASGRNYRGFMV